MSGDSNTKVYYLSKSAIESACNEHWLPGSITSKMEDVIVGSLNALSTITPGWKVSEMKLISPPDLFSGIERLADYRSENAIIVNGICIHEWDCEQDVTNKFSIE